MITGNRLEKYIEIIEKFVAQGGPEESEWNDFTNLINQIYSDIQSKMISEQGLKKIYEAFGDSLSTDTLQGYAFIQPCGYSGDYQIIDKFYTYKLNDNFIK